MGENAACCKDGAPRLPSEDPKGAEHQGSRDGATTPYTGPPSLWVRRLQQSPAAPLILGPGERGELLGLTALLSLFFAAREIRKLQPYSAILTFLIS